MFDLKTIIAIGSLFCGSFTAYFTWKKYKTSHDSIRLSLYEKRFKIYELTKSFINTFLTSGKINDEEVGIFYNSTIESSFIFDNEVAEYLKTLREKANDWIALKADLDYTNDLDTRKIIVDKQQEIRNFYMNKLENIGELMGPYLKFIDKN